MSKEELLELIKALTDSDSAKQNPYIKLSKTNWDTLGRPLQIFGREVIPIPGFPDERIYITSTSD